MIEAAIDPSVGKAPKASATKATKPMTTASLVVGKDAKLWVRVAGIKCRRRRGRHRPRQRSASPPWARSRWASGSLRTAGRAPTSPWFAAGSWSWCQAAAVAPPLLTKTVSFSPKGQ
jgi:hypothetical protein